MAGFFARLAKLRRAWLVFTSVFTIVVLPIGRMLWKRSRTVPTASKKQIIDVTAHEVPPAAVEKKSDQS